MAWVYVRGGKVGGVSISKTKEEAKGERAREREREREHAGGEIVVGVGFLHHQHDQPDDQSGFGRVKY